MRVSLAAEAAALCRDLVRCPSPSGQEGAAAEVALEAMATLGYDRVTRDALGSVVGTVQGARPGPTLVIDAHLDVVPAGDEAAWRHPPYAAVEAEGRIWGRGAIDVKGSLAAALVALASLPRERLAGRAVLAATVGEELIEGVALREVLARHGGDVVVVCEPTGLRLGLGHKGRAGLVVRAEGRAAHSSQPELGINAVYRMIEAVARLRDLAPRSDPELGSGVSALVEVASEPMPGTSVVPYGCTARYDRRLVRGETPESVLAEVHGALEGLEGLSARYHRAPLACYTGARVEIDDFRPAWVQPADSEPARRALGALQAAGLPAEPWLAPYSTNGAASAGELGLPTFIYGAGDISAAHAVDEALEVEALAEAVRGYRALALAFLGG